MGGGGWLGRAGRSRPDCRESPSRPARVRRPGAEHRQHWPGTGPTGPPAEGGEPRAGRCGAAGAVAIETLFGRDGGGLSQESPVNCVLSFPAHASGFIGGVGVTSACVPLPVQQVIAVYPQGKRLGLKMDAVTVVSSPANLTLPLWCGLGCSSQTFVVIKASPPLVARGLGSSESSILTILMH